MTNVLLVGDRLRPLVERLEPVTETGLALEWVSSVEEACAMLTFDSFSHVVVCGGHQSMRPNSLLSRLATGRSTSPDVVLVEFEEEPVEEESTIDSGSFEFGDGEPSVGDGEPSVGDGEPSVGDVEAMGDGGTGVGNGTSGIDGGESRFTEKAIPGDGPRAFGPPVELVRVSNLELVETRVRALLDEHSFDEAVRRDRQLRTVLLEAANELLGGTDRAEFESSLCRRFVTSGLYTVSWMSRYNDDTDTLVPTAAAGIDPAALAHRPVPLGVREETAPSTYVTETADGSRTIAVPIAVNGTFYGLLSLVSADDVSPSEREVLATFGDSLAADLDRRERRDADSLVLEHFCRAVTHEFRTQLQTANAGVDHGQGDEADESTETVEAALERMTRLTDQVRALGNAPLDDESMERTELGETARRAWEHVEDRSGKLEVVDSTAVSADHLLLEVFFENLFRNSVVHGDEPTIRVGLRDDGFFVVDDGPGIAPSLKHAVFEWGFTTTDDRAGTGLSLANYIATAHGWSLDINDGPDGGVRFDVTGVSLDSDTRV